MATGQGKRTVERLSELNAAQRAAVTTLAGPLLVLAGAGTGKTRVVTYRIAHLIAHGVAAERILAVTFTNKAADEMRERVGELLGRAANCSSRGRRGRFDEDRPEPEISTFHSLCLRILRRHIRHLGYPKAFAIYDVGDQESIAARALRELSVPTETLRPRDLRAIISGWKARGVRPPEAVKLAATDKEHFAAVAYRRYQDALRQAGAVDFDDLLMLTEELFRKVPKVCHEEAGRLDHILIDEYQDTNASQYRIIRSLAAPHRNLCVVGDDDQSIYGWRGAEVEHILRFGKDWPDARIVRLEENYRCTEEILRLANRLIRFNAVRHDKTLRAARPGGERPRLLQFSDEVTEARETIRDIQKRLDRPGAEPGDFAILFRTNEQPRLFESELRDAKLPYVLVGGMSFYDRREIRDLLAYLKVLANPDDEPSLLRIINTPARGISQKLVKGLINEAVCAGKPVWRLLPSADRLPDCSHIGARAVDQFRHLVEAFRRRLRERPLSKTVEELVEHIGYRQEIERRYRDDPLAIDARWQAVGELVNAIAEYESRTKSPSLRDFLDSAALTRPEEDRDKESQLRRNAVVLMTLHSAKGLEFPEVYMVGMEEGLLPHRRSVQHETDTGALTSIEEERRLCYVGITRAQERLTLSLALTRRKWGKPRPSLPSRFLYELTGKARP